MPIFDEAPFDVLFIRRAAHLRRHAGQIAFPGGAVDDDDADHVTAALRELGEEVGIPPHAVRIVARLPSVRQSRRGNFEVVPFVGIVRGGTPLLVDPNEAADVHRIPLGEILRPDAVRLAIHEDAERRIETFVFDYGDVHVWGLTARILADFLASYRAADSELRQQLETALSAI